MAKAVFVITQIAGSPQYKPMHLASVVELRSCNRLIKDKRGEHVLTPQQMDAGEREMHRIFTQQQKQQRF